MTRPTEALRESSSSTLERIKVTRIKTGLLTSSHQCLSITMKAVALNGGLTHGGPDRKNVVAKIPGLDLEMSEVQDNRSCGRLSCIQTPASISIMAPVPTTHLSNPLVTPEQLSSSGSQLDGIPSDLETSIRFAGARLTQAAGILLKLPQDVIAQAIVVFTRFWVGSEGGSLRQYDAKVCIYRS